MAYPLPGMCKTLAVRPRQVGWDAYAGGWINYPGGVSGAVFRSTDFGATWESLPSSPPDSVFGVSVPTGVGINILCATPSGLYRSADTGRSWSQALEAGGLRAVACGQGIGVTGGDSGVWLSRDSGNTWAKFDTGLAVTKVTCLEFAGDEAPSSLRLLAGTQGGAVYSWDFGPTAAAEPHTRERGSPGTANVCRGRLTVNLSRTAQVRLHDVSGRVVLRQTLPQGESRLDVSRLAAGVYHLVSVPGSSTAHKVVVSR
jgi:photosystem II stability/assembly factor-like uncharacterized protein